MPYVGQKRYGIVCVLILIMLSGCGICSQGNGSFCGIYEPVYTSDSDTEETRRQVDQNNAVWWEECR